MKPILDRAFSSIEAICNDIERQREIEGRTFGDQYIAKVYALKTKNTDVSIKFRAKNLRNRLISSHDRMEVAQINQRIWQNSEALLQDLRAIPMFNHDDVSVDIKIYMPRETPYLRLSLDRLIVGESKSGRRIQDIKKQAETMLGFLGKIPPQFMEGSFRRFKISGDTLIHAPTPEAALYKYQSTGQPITGISEQLDRQSLFGRLEAALERT